MRRDVLTSIALDEGTAELLAVIAKSETAGNRSAAVRRCVREAATVRGLFTGELRAAGSIGNRPSFDPQDHGGIVP